MNVKNNMVMKKLAKKHLSRAHTLTKARRVLQELSANEFPGYVVNQGQRRQLTMAWDLTAIPKANNNDIANASEDMNFTDDFDIYHDDMNYDIVPTTYASDDKEN